jgi:hypothetical protein
MPLGKKKNLYFEEASAANTKHHQTHVLFWGVASAGVVLLAMKATQN